MHASQLELLTLGGVEIHPLEGASKIISQHGLEYHGASGKTHRNRLNKRKRDHDYHWTSQSKDRIQRR